MKKGKLMTAEIQVLPVNTDVWNLDNVFILYYLKYDQQASSIGHKEGC